MKVIVPCNNKGGVGKTCVTSLLAEYFSKVLKKKTLIIDLDPQCNISQRYLEMEVDHMHREGHQPPIHCDYDENDPEDIKWAGRSSSADVFLYPELGIVPYPTMESNLEILPAHAANLLSVEQCRQNDVAELIYDRLSALFSLPDIQAEYDYVVIDTAPSKGPLTRSAMRSATDIIIPTQMEDKPIRGVFGIMQLWAQENSLRGAHNQLNLIGILPNMVDARTALHSSMLNSVSDDPVLGPHIIPFKLKRRIIYAENDTEFAVPKSIFDYSKNHDAKKECLALCEYVFSKITQEKLEVIA